jgi:hypothetical protein
MTVTRKAAYARLEKKLTVDRTTILTQADVRLLTREVRRLLTSSVPGLSDDVLARTDDTIRWRSMAARCYQARGERGLGIRDVAAGLQIPQYRLRAIETGRLAEFRLDLARRYFRFLKIEDWVEGWCRANRELAARVGLLDLKPRGGSRRVRPARRD